MKIAVLLPFSYSTELVELLKPKAEVDLFLPTRGEEDFFITSDSTVKVFPLETIKTSLYDWFIAGVYSYRYLDDLRIDDKKLIVLNDKLERKKKNFFPLPITLSIHKVISLLGVVEKATFYVLISASLFGKEGIEHLAHETRALFSLSKLPSSKFFPYQLAFNFYPLPSIVNDTITADLQELEPQFKGKIFLFQNSVFQGVTVIVHIDNPTTHTFVSDKTHTQLPNLVDTFKGEKEYESYSLSSQDFVFFLDPLKIAARAVARAVFEDNGQR